MSYSTIERLVINSQTDRQPNDSTHDFTSYLRNPIGTDYHRSRKLALCATTVSVPNDAYQVSYANSHLYFQTKDISTDAINEYLLQINYNKYYKDIAAFAAYLTNEFNEQHAFTVLVEYDTDEQALKFTPNISGKYFRFVSDRKYEPYGYNDSVLTNRGNMKFGLISDFRNFWTGPTSSFYSLGICELRRTDVIHILSESISINTMTPSGYAAAPILLTVPAASYGTRSVFSPQEKNWHILNDSSIDSIKFKLVDSEFIEYNVRESNVMIILEFAIYNPEG